MRRRGVYLVALVCASCSSDVSEVKVMGDASAVGARVLVDGVEDDTMKAEPYDGPLLIAKSSGLNRMWGDEQVGDTVAAPGQMESSLDLYLGAGQHRVMVIRAGDTLRASITPRVYNIIKVSFRRKRVIVDTE